MIRNNPCARSKFIFNSRTANRIDRLFNLINTVCTQILSIHILCTVIISLHVYVSLYGKLCDKHRFTLVRVNRFCGSWLLNFSSNMEGGEERRQLLLFNCTGGERDERNGRGIFEYSEDLHSVASSEYRYPLSVNQHRWLAIDIYIPNVGTRQRFVCTIILCYLIHVVGNTDMPISVRNSRILLFILERERRNFVLCSVRIGATMNFSFYLEDYWYYGTKFVWDIFEFLSFLISIIFIWKKFMRYFWDIVR